MTTRVRFAPSPTGFLHIGGARTALFNWLFARHTRGVFVLRIEDTDEVRSTAESVEAIFHGLRWLGLDWDEGPVSPGDAGTSQGSHGPYFQMQRLPLYREAADRLLAQGAAYPCYCTPEEVEKMRERAQLLKRPPRYDGTCRRLAPAQREARSAEGRSHVLRFKSPAEGATAFEDIVRGPLNFENGLIEDFILLKTSGVPTYNFACVVDDHAMDITHVIRGDDHLSNTPRQILCYEALGWTPPRFAHLSMILGPDGTRLSKRHGAASVQEYEQAGFLSEAVRNYLALLGWATEDSQQLFAREELVAKFTLERCGKSPAIFDPQKLLWMNGEYMRSMPMGEVVERSLPFLRAAGTLAGQEEARRPEVEAALALEHDKLKLLADAPKLIEFFFKPVEFDPASVQKTLARPDAGDLLREVLASFEKLSAMTASATEEAARAVALRREVKNALVFHPIRVAVSGRMQGPSLFHMLEVMGRDMVLARLREALEKIQNQAFVLGGGPGERRREP